MQIVVNEWLLEYMCPNAESNNRQMTIQFLNAIVKKCDKMVIGNPSSFVSKFYRFMKKFGWDIDFKEGFKKLNLLLFRNSDKTIIIDSADKRELPKEIEEEIPAGDDDRYLVELAYCTIDRIIVTTDTPLKEKLHGKDGFKVYLLGEFLKEYLTNN